AGLDPVRLVDADHEAGLIVQFVVSRRDPELGGEIARGRILKKMACVARKTVMRLTPEIGVRIGGDVQHAVPQIPVARLVEPAAVFEHRSSSCPAAAARATVRSDPAFAKCRDLAFRQLWRRGSSLPQVCRMAPECSTARPPGGKLKKAARQNLAP